MLVEEVRKAKAKDLVEFTRFTTGDPSIERIIRTLFFFLIQKGKSAIKGLF